MQSKQIILITSMLLAANTANAIPPPDAFVSIWQSVLQILGIVSVFLVGAYYSIKQFFAQVFSQWKRPLLVVTTLSITSCIALGFYFGIYDAKVKLSINDTEQTTLTAMASSDIPAADPRPIPNNIIQGEQLSVEAVINREKDDYARQWKQKTFKEMKLDISIQRKKNQLPAIDYSVITSFTPKALLKHRTQSPNDLFFLDVRGAFERKSFYIPYHASARYGDLLADTLLEPLRKRLPKNKRIVVICHSGLRGYLAANILKRMGYHHVSFLQGGLANWHEQKLPTIGDESATNHLAAYPLFTEEQAHQIQNVQKVELDPDDKFIQDIPGLVHLPFESATSKAIYDIINRSKQKPVLMVCRTYGGCFHVLNFGYLIEKSGGKVAGIFDKSGEHVIPPAD